MRVSEPGIYYFWPQISTLNWLVSLLSGKWWVLNKGKVSRLFVFFFRAIMIKGGYSLIVIIPLVVIVNFRVGENKQNKIILSTKHVGQIRVTPGLPGK